MENGIRLIAPMENMPIRTDFFGYHKSIAQELEATKDRVRQLIGSTHWETDGEHKEAIIRKVLRNHLPESMRIGKGFVCFESHTSTQIDVLITAVDKPTLFKDGELVLVTPDAVHAVIEVKTAMRSKSNLTEALEKLADNLEHIRQTQTDCLGGLFVFQESNGRVTDKAVLEELQRIVGSQSNRVINWVALSPDRFFRFWRAGDVPSICCGDFWHSYKLCEGLAHAYFLSNVAWDVTKEPNHEMQYAWFPVEGGKEKFRQWCVSLQEANGEPKQFGNGGV
jgi:hypothetical protein